MYSVPPRSIHSYDREMTPLLAEWKRIRATIIEHQLDVDEETRSGWYHEFARIERRLMQLRREKTALGYYTGIPR